MKRMAWNPDADHDADPRLSRRVRRDAKSARRAVGCHSSVEAALRADDRVAMWLADPLDFKAAQMLVRAQSLPGLARLAVMPDVHPSADVCVGSVMGVDGVVFPRAIGGDIGCGMSAVALGTADAFDAEACGEVLRAMSKCVDVAYSRGEVQPPPGTLVPDSDRLSDARLRALARGEGRTQMGTLGRGNHFVELQRDEAGVLWIMVHSGSRFMGQAVVRHHTAVAGRVGVRAALEGLRVETCEGESYLADQTWCVAWAAANRRILLAAAARAVASVFGVRPAWGGVLDVPHNFVRIETHEGRALVVHRKGAAPAAAGEVGLIPGSAGTISVHVEGRGEPRAMASSSHGAGRVLSRSEAKAAVNDREFREQMRGVAYDERWSRSLRDEAPGVYRDLRTVLEAQRDLVKVTRTLRPLVSFKAGG